MVPESYYLALSALLFAIGTVGVIVRRNPLVIFMSIELMLNAVNLSFVAFGHRLGSHEGEDRQRHQTVRSAGIGTGEVGRPSGPTGSRDSSISFV